MRMHLIVVPTSEYYRFVIMLTIVIIIIVGLITYQTVFDYCCFLYKLLNI